MMFFYKGTTDILAGENTKGIDAAAVEDRLVLHLMMHRMDQCSESVNRKHPDRGLPFEAEILIKKGVKRGEDDLHTPSRQPTDQKIFLHKNSMFIVESLCVKLT